MSDKVNFGAAGREGGLGRIKERLDKVRVLIQKSDFLEGKGLSNEVNIRIFCYDPEDEMIVRHFVNQLETDQSLDCHLIVCNLYKIFLSICDDMDITDAIPDMEEADGSAYLLQELNSSIRNREFVDKIQYGPHEQGCPNADRCWRGISFYKNACFIGGIAALFFRCSNFSYVSRRI